jgi:hypothetical protein
MDKTFSFSKPVRFVLVNQEDCEPYLVVVEDEMKYAETIRYLDDCGISYSEKEIEPVTPGELSDLIMPRDD